MLPIGLRGSAKCLKSWNAQKSRPKAKRLKILTQKPKGSKFSRNSQNSQNPHPKTKRLKILIQRLKKLTQKLQQPHLLRGWYSLRPCPSICVQFIKSPVLMDLVVFSLVMFWKIRLELERKSISIFSSGEHLQGLRSDGCSISWLSLILNGWIQDED